MKIYNDYIAKGIIPEKLHQSKVPSICLFSLSKNKIIENNSDVYDLVPDNEGNLKLTIGNNRFVSLLVQSSLSEEDVNKINNSNGIIIASDESYYTEKQKEYFRFGYIPNE